MARRLLIRIVHLNLWEAKAMKRKVIGWLTLPLLLILFGFGSAESYTNFGFGFSVGNYDYLPYGRSSVGVSVDFNNVMGDYGNWVNVPRFGRCWRPYATSGWRPYLYGHWDYTSYGPTWEGYEPWAWIGYHYGNWIFTQEFGWVWIPGYDWSPGRVIWGYDSDAIGWMPAPPYGYSYGCGYLNYGNCGYSDPFYSPGFTNISFNLFVFIDRHRFWNDNYADFYLGRDYARNVFVRRAVRFENRPLQRSQLEGIVGGRINEVPVRTREIRLRDRTLRAVVPEGGDARIRRNADRVINQVIAPAIKDKRRNFEANDRERGLTRMNNDRQFNNGRQFEKNRQLNAAQPRSNRDFIRNNNGRKSAPDFATGRNGRDRQFERSRIRNDHFATRDQNFGSRQTDRNRGFDTRGKMQRNRENFNRNNNGRRFQTPDNSRERDRNFQRYQPQRHEMMMPSERHAPPQQRFEGNNRPDRNTQMRGEGNQNNNSNNDKKKKPKKPQPE